MPRQTDLFIERPWKELLVGMHLVFKVRPGRSCLWGCTRCLKSDLCSGGDQLPTTLLQVFDLPGRLLVQPDSEGCDPNPTLQVAEIKVVITRLPQGTGGNGSCHRMSWGRNQFGGMPTFADGAHSSTLCCRMNHLGSAPLSYGF